MAGHWIRCVRAEVKVGAVHKFPVLQSVPNDHVHRNRGAIPSSVKPPGQISDLTSILTTKIGGPKERH